MKETQLDRLLLLWSEERLTNPWLEDRTSSDRVRWKNIKAGKVEIRGVEIEEIGKLFPEYKMWLAYGEELPEAGQISPMTKKAQRTLKNQPKAG
jgi:outer membrane receptor for monomeric catechols